MQNHFAFFRFWYLKALNFQLKMTLYPGCQGGRGFANCRTISVLQWRQWKHPCEYPAFWILRVRESKEAKKFPHSIKKECSSSPHLNYYSVEILFENVHENFNVSPRKLQDPSLRNPGMWFPRLVKIRWCSMPEVTTTPIKKSPSYHPTLTAGR